MSDNTYLATMVQSALQDIAKQALTLGTGLQNAAPGDKVKQPNMVISYLLETADNLNQLAKECEAIVSDQH
jgi:hypothetical protein